MAYDEALTQRMRSALQSTEGVTERRMMGGVCFMLHGNMLSGADRKKDGVGRFMFRVGKAQQDKALSRKGASVMEQGGRVMTGLIFVDEKDCDQRALKSWLALASRFVASLPSK